MLEKIILGLFGLIILSISFVCLHYLRKNKKNDNIKHRFFWTWTHFKTIFTSKTIRNRILFTIFAIIVFRLGTLVTIPNIDSAGLIKALNENPLIAMMNLLGAGGLEQFSLFSLGVGPYITSSIIIQLLSMDVIHHFTELSKQGQIGRMQLNSYTKYLAVIFAFIQSIALVYGFSKMYPGLFEEGFKLSSVLFIALVFTAGTTILVWIGDQITKKGLGNGMSILIATGIISRMPTQFQNAYQSLVSGELVPENGMQLFIGLIGVMIVIIIFIGLLNSAEYRVPIQYTSNTVSLERKQNNYLPLKFNSANVIPVIFASSIMTVPLQLLMYFGKEHTDWIKLAQEWLGMQTWYSLVIYALLILFFCFFYTQLQINPEDLSTNLAKSGAYIPDVRPGKNTELFIKKLLNKLTIIGSVALVTIAILPFALPILWPEFPSSIPLGGTGMIIVVGVVMETYKLLKGLIVQESYVL